MYLKHKIFTSLNLYTEVIRLDINKYIIYYYTSKQIYNSGSVNDERTKIKEKLLVT